MNFNTRHNTANYSFFCIQGTLTQLNLYHMDCRGGPAVITAAGQFPTSRNNNSPNESSKPSDINQNHRMKPQIPGASKDFPQARVFLDNPELPWAFQNPLDSRRTSREPTNWFVLRNMKIAIITVPCDSSIFLIWICLDTALHPIEAS